MSISGTGNCQNYIFNGVKDGSITIEVIAYKQVELDIEGKPYGTTTINDYRISGKTYDVKDYIKREFHATWNKQDKCWETHLLDSDPNKADSLCNLMCSLMGVDYEPTVYYRGEQAEDAEQDAFSRMAECLNNIDATCEDEGF